MGKQDRMIQAKHMVDGTIIWMNWSTRMKLTSLGITLEGSKPYSGRRNSFIWKDERKPKGWELCMHVGNWCMSHRSDGDVAGDRAVPKKEKA